MKILVEFLKDSAVTALNIYGLIALTTVVFPSLGPASALWVVAPIAFVIQFGLKLAFSRDEQGHLRRVSKS
ncbi:hypothetical protein C8J35_1238 [Rhizobium sp. PP-F2F-G38]|nr:hypothetical protein C8J35_1238 [Rhizobium sp. PP-F2F-G38]